MGIHESAVNYQNLIRDLAEMYPFDVAEVVVVELVANSLDAQASRISIDFDARRKVLIVTDNGRGMNGARFEEYHDFAAGLKARGQGIGFAGLGAKISFNIADRVITETSSKSLSRASNWFLQSKKKLLWEDIRATHLAGYGTRVEVHFRPDARPPYSSSEDLTKLLRRHYLPLLDPKFLSLYEKLGYYSRDLRFIVNEEVIRPAEVTVQFALEQVKEFFPRKAGRRFGYGIFGIAPTEYPLAPDICGVLLSARGKVIKAELFNQFPGSYAPRIFGLVEVPDFAQFLTTNKTDFIRKGRYREVEKLYDPIRQEFKAWLRDLGLATLEVAGSDEAARLEKELRRLVDDVPELAEFAGFRDRKNLLTRSETDLIPAGTEEGVEGTYPLGTGRRGEGPGPFDTGNEPGQVLVENPDGGEKARSISRSARRGPKITFVNAPDRLDLAWVEGGHIAINSGHPSYTKAQSDALARRLHSLFAIAGAVQRFIATQTEAPDLMFIDRMIAAWGRK